MLSTINKKSNTKFGTQTTLHEKIRTKGNKIQKRMSHLFAWDSKQNGYSTISIYKNNEKKCFTI